jgi:hypothetical protein
MLVAALLLVAMPLQAQKARRKDPNKISVEELTEFGDQNMGDVIPRLRPNFLMFNGGGGAGLGEQTISGVQAAVLVYVGTQQQGDTSMLREFKASDVKEVRYFKPGNASSPQPAANAFVIQLLMKEHSGGP